MTVLSDLATAVLLGSALAAGVLLAARRVPRWSAQSLTHRIGPYLRDVADPLGLTPLGVPQATWRVRRDRILDRLGGAELIERRLAQAGWRLTAAAFRIRQLAWGIVGLVTGGLVLVVLALAGRFTAGGILLPATLAAGAAVGCDAVLTAAARRRSHRIAEEVPTVLEFLALCLAAGESLIDALRRVGDVGAGDLTRHLRAAVLATGTGSSLAEALSDVARTVEVPSVTRAIDQLVAAIDRGAPLAHVLQAQASDAREEAKRSLIEQAGRKEILMLFPLVFLVLPLSVLFAVFPGVVMLRLGL